MSLMRTLGSVMEARKYDVDGDGANDLDRAPGRRNTIISDRESSPALSRSLSMSLELAPREEPLGRGGPLLLLVL
jgi:hypothetical protein